MAARRGPLTLFWKRALAIEATSNRLLSFTQTVTKARAGKTKSVVTKPVSYALDVAGNLTSDGLKTFDYDDANRLQKAALVKEGEAASVIYLHNAMGHRVFTSEPRAERVLPQKTP